MKSTRLPLLRLARAELEAGRALVALLLALFARRPAAVPSLPQADGGTTFRRDVRPGDTLLCLGATWGIPDYAGRLRVAQQRYGLHPALLVYDIVPVRHPEWCPPDIVRIFGHWLESVLPLCRSVLAISRATAHDVERYAAEHNIALRCPVCPLPMGTGFSVPPGDDDPVPARPLPQAGSYILFVSTIEARKNHGLLVRMWRRLLADMPPETVPTLVFAGHVGWLVNDFMQQLRNSAFLNGKIRLEENPSDPELAALYRGCLFTLFPSLYEGWGLPVTESLAFGKPCLASNVTAMPEAGGTLARYFDPENVAEATRIIRATIEDRAGLAAWEEQVRREFRPVPWAAAADALIATLRQNAAAGH